MWMIYEYITLPFPLNNDFGGSSCWTLAVMYIFYRLNCKYSIIHLHDFLKY